MLQTTTGLRPVVSDHNLLGKARRMKVALSHLNGWQRLWLVTAAAWLIAVVVPTISSVRASVASRAWRVAEIRLNWAAERSRLESGGAPFDPFALGLATEVKPDGLPLPKPATLLPVTTIKENVAALDRDIEKQLAQISEETDLGLVARALAAWIIPVILLYPLGLLVHWVYRGFRSDRRKA